MKVTGETTFLLYKHIHEQSRRGEEKYDGHVQRFSLLIPYTFFVIIIIFSGVVNYCSSSTEATVPSHVAQRTCMTVRQAGRQAGREGGGKSRGLIFVS